MHSLLVESFVSSEIPSLTVHLSTFQDVPI